MPYEFKLVRSVEFHETDMAGIVHFSNFFRYMEAVEHAFFRSLGHSVLLRNFDPPLGLPRVHASCDYFAPLRFEDQVEMHLVVTDKKPKALSYRIHFRKTNVSPSVEVARGRLTVVCVRRLGDGSFRSVPLPAAVADLIEVAPGEQALDPESNLH